MVKTMYLLMQKLSEIGPSVVQTTWRKLECLSAKAVKILQENLNYALDEAKSRQT